MGRRERHYEITEAVRGSFVGAGGRIRYDLEPGRLPEKDLDPEVLALLLEAGLAVDPEAKASEAAQPPAESEEA